ncbi:hypothetical protein ES708_28813 [subsurface metagenome]
MIQNYVRVNSLLDSKVGTVIAVIFFIVTIFAAGFFLGRIMRIKKLEDGWDKKLAELQKEINEIWEKAGISKGINPKKED